MRAKASNTQADGLSALSTRPQHAALDVPSGLRGAALRALAGLLFALLALRFAALWVNAFSGVSVPVLVPGSIGFTLLFTGFSLLHAASRLGWARALIFLTVCALVCWCFEALGVRTGLVYGQYHYGDQLGAKLGGVPIIIPLAWFMMVYASWIVAQLLLRETDNPDSSTRTAMRVVVAAMAMTAWDTIIDPGMARSGTWTWEQGGTYFGVPMQNFVGWLATTVTVYAVTELLFRRMFRRRIGVIAGLYDGLPAILYTLVAADRLVLPDFPELRIVAAFGMGFVGLLAVLQLALTPRLAGNGQEARFR